MPYPSRGGWRFRNVTDAFDFAPILTSIQIEELHPDGLSVISCDVKDEPGMAFTNEDKVWVKFDGDKIWAGHVKVRTRTFLDEKSQRIKLWNLQGQDFTSKLEDSVITYRPDRSRESADDRVAFILQHLNFNLTTSNVDLPAENVDRANYEGLTVREALDQVSSELLLHYYVDFGDDGGVPDLHMFRQETEAAPFSLDVDDPNYSSRFPFSEFSFDNDSQDYKNAVYVIGKDIRRWVINQQQIDIRGRQETAVIDSSLTTQEQVLAAGRRVLDQNDSPEVHGSLLMHEPGIRAGMRIGVRLDAWSIDTNYFVTSVNIEAVDPEDAANEAYLFSRLTFTDKRRVGRMPGGGRRHHHPPDKSGDGRPPIPPGGGGGGGPDVPPTPVPTPTGEYEIEDWTSTAPSGYPEEIVGQTTVSLGTAHHIFIPDGADLAGRELLVYFTTTHGTSQDIIDELAPYGLTVLHNGDNGGNSQALLHMPLTGLDGFFGIDDALDITTAASETVIARVAIVSGVSEWTVAGSSSAITPAVSGWTGENAILYVFGSDNAAVTGTSFPPDIIDDQTSGGAAMRVARGNITSGSNPGDWTMTGTARYSITTAGRYTDPGWGYTLAGQGVETDAPWSGRNKWYPFVPQGSATFTTSTTTGIITIGTNNTEAWASLYSDSVDDPNGQPWCVWADADGTMRCLWKVNRLGILTDAFTNAVEWRVQANDWSGYFRVHLGDATDPTYSDPGDIGIVIAQGTSGATASAFVDKTLVANTYYMTRFDFSGTNARMKLWTASESEPVAWDIDVVKVPDLTIGQLSIFRMVVYGGTNTSALVATYDTLWGGSGAQSAPGGLVLLDLPRGDGITTVWDIGPYEPGSPMMTVDGMATIVTETDPEAGTITFDRAPALGAWVGGTKVNPI